MTTMSEWSGWWATALIAASWLWRDRLSLMAAGRWLMANGGVRGVIVKLWRGSTLKKNDTNG